MPLNSEQIKYARKKLEYKKNPIKFIEECVVLPTTGGDKPFKMYEPQKEMVKNFFLKHNLVVLKSRQIGISTITQAIITYLCTFFKNIKIGIISRDRSEASDFCRKVQTMIDKLPDWLKPEYSNKSIQYFVMKNGCELHTGAVSPHNPSSTFRGKTLTLLVIDEAAFIPNVDAAWTGISPALSRAHKDAEMNGIPYGALILSTPNKMEGIGKWYFGKWIAATTGESDDTEEGEDSAFELAFHPVKIHWKEIPDFANDPNWYKKQCAMLENNKNKIAQELDLKFVGSEGSLFQEDVQIQLQNCGMDAVEKIPAPRGLGEIWKFQKINRQNFHIIAVDCASAAGDDFSAMQVLEYETMAQVMEYRGKLGTKDFADVVRVAAMHAPNNIIVVENTGGYGDVVLTELINDPDIDYNVYGEYKEKRGKTEFIPGINTNPVSRRLILDSLYEVITFDPQLIRSKRLVSELLGLVNTHGKVEADKGFHDDLSLAYAFACYVRQHLSDYIIAERMSDDDLLEAHKVIKGETFRMAMDLNRDPSRKIPISHDTLYDPDNPENFRSNLDKYLIDKVMSGDLNGFIDVMEVWKPPSGY